MEKWDWNQKWDCLSFMVHVQVVEKWVLWPQGPWWTQAKLNQALHDNTHIQLCIKHMNTYFGEGPFHVHSWQDQRWQMFSTKTRTCHSYKVNHDTTWIFKHFGLFGKRKKKLTNIISFLHIPLMNYILLCMYFTQRFWQNTVSAKSSTMHKVKHT